MEWMTMKPNKPYLLRSFSLLLLVFSFAGSPSHAFDLGVLKNDKELKTRWYNTLDLWLAKKRFGTPSQESKSKTAFELLGKTLNELEESRSLCEPELIRILKSKLNEAGISSSHSSIHQLLITWRSENLIDDVLFGILDQNSEMFEHMQFYKAQKIRSIELKKSSKLLAKKEVPAETLRDAYASLTPFTLENPGCSLNAWVSLSQNLALPTQDIKKVRFFNIAALANHFISEETFALAEFLNEEFYPNEMIPLGKYLNIVRTVKNSDRSKSPSESEMQPNKLSSKIISPKIGLTYRENLYTKFNALQISMITDVMKKTLERMDATKAELVFTFSNGTESIPISPMGQYYLVRKLLRKDLYDLMQSTFFGGMPITHEDLVTASLESGLISADMLDSVLKIDDLWNPNVKPWQKITDFAFRITGTATIFVPPPYNIISSLALVFIDGMITKKTTKPSQADPFYDFF